MYVCTDLCIHVGTKNVAKELAKLTKGHAKDKGVTWFPELFEAMPDHIILRFICLI